MKPIVALAAVLLCGCASTGQWTRENVTEAQIRAGLARCRDEASAATERNRGIDYDIAAAPGDRRDDRIGSLRGEMRSYGTTQLYHDIVDRCMRLRGYHPAGESG